MTSTQTSMQDAAQLALGMSTAELRVRIERCARLMQQSTLLSRLPDKGKDIRHRHDVFAAELQRREGSGADDAAGVVPVTCEAAPSDSAHACSEVGQQQQQKDIVEKYRHYRVLVESVVRRTFGATLNERELQRMIDDVPAHYFLTYDETVKMQRTQAKELRQRELQQLSAVDAYP